MQFSPAEFAALRITTPDGDDVPLESIAQLRRDSGPVKIDREMGSRYSVVIANVSGRDLVGFVDEAKASVAQNGQAADRLSHHLGRPVREPAACRRAADAGGARWRWG